MEGCVTPNRFHSSAPEPGEPPLGLQPGRARPPSLRRGKRGHAGRDVRAEATRASAQCRASGEAGRAAPTVPKPQERQACGAGGAAVAALAQPGPRPIPSRPMAGAPRSLLWWPCTSRRFRAKWSPRCHLARLRATNSTCAVLPSFSQQYDPRSMSGESPRSLPAFPNSRQGHSPHSPQTPNV